MDFIDKKEKLANLLEEYLSDVSKKEDLLNIVKEFKQDSDFAGKELFSNLFNELTNYLSELSSKELKQRILIIRSYME
jgi:histidyl-tRNA synthetase